jgi:hypothetical protein
MVGWRVRGAARVVRAARVPSGQPPRPRRSRAGLGRQTARRQVDGPGARRAARAGVGLCKWGSRGAAHVLGRPRKTRVPGPRRREWGGGGHGSSGGGRRRAGARAATQRSKGRGKTSPGGAGRGRRAQTGARPGQGRRGVAARARARFAGLVDRQRVALQLRHPSGVSRLLLNRAGPGAPCRARAAAPRGASRRAARVSRRPRAPGRAAAAGGGRGGAQEARATGPAAGQGQVQDRSRAGWGPRGRSGGGAGRHSGRAGAAVVEARIERGGRPLGPPDQFFGGRLVIGAGRARGSVKGRGEPRARAQRGSAGARVRGWGVGLGCPLQQRQLKGEGGLPRCAARGPWHRRVPYAGRAAGARRGPAACHAWPGAARGGRGAARAAQRRRAGAALGSSRCRRAPSDARASAGPRRGGAGQARPRRASGRRAAEGGLIRGKGAASAGRRRCRRPTPASGRSPRARAA